MCSGGAGFFGGGGSGITGSITGSGSSSTSSIIISGLTYSILIPQKCRYLFGRA